MQILKSLRSVTPLGSLWSAFLLLRSMPIGAALLMAFIVPLGRPSEILGQKTEAPAGNVSVLMLSGPPIVGTIVFADASKVIVNTEAGTIEKPAAEILRINFPGKLVLQSPQVELFLLDGSRVFGDGFTGKSGSWQLKDSAGLDVAIAVKTLKAARLKSIPPDLAAAWEIAIQVTKNADAVIVQRPTSNFDRIDGVIVQVDAERILFDLDGQQIDIPIEKLAGLVWFQRDLERIKPTIEVRSTDHSVWMAESLLLKSNQVELRTQVGQSVSIPLQKILSINYGTANIRWLSEVESLEAVAANPIDFRTPNANLDRAMAPRFVVSGRGPSSTSLAADKDLYFPSPGHFTFRVPVGFSSMQCRVERTDDGLQRTDLMIEVWQEDQKVSQQALAHDLDFVELNLPLASGKKTKLAVTCKSKLMIGTEVMWKQPRLMR